MGDKRLLLSISIVILFLSKVVAQTPQVNLISPANGGIFEDSLSDYTKYGKSYGPTALANGVTNEIGWASKRKPSTQEFVYSFQGGATAVLDNVVIHGGTAEGKYYSKDVEIWVSQDGLGFSQIAGGTLPRARNRSITLDMSLVQAAYVKLVIKNGYRTDYWELAEFVVNGTLIEVEAPTNLVSPKNEGILERSLSNFTEYGRGYVVQDLTNGVTNEDGWSSKRKPKTSQEFVYSFKDGNTALLDNVVIHGGKAEGKYFSKDVEVWTSLNGTQFSRIASGRLPRERNRSITLNMGLVEAAYVKLVIKSGYRKDYWELAEFVVNGDFVDTDDPNLVPTANAGPDQITELGITVFLDGSRSSDPEGDPLTYSWSPLEVPAGSSATLSDLNVVNPSFQVDVIGEYVAELIVNDGDPNSDSAPDQVLISTDNIHPVADAGPDQPASINQLIQLDGSNSSDVDGNLLNFSWSLISIPTGSVAVLSDPNSVYPEFLVDVPGQYTAELIVNDGSINSEPDQVVINTENTPPVADAGPDQTAILGEMIQLDASGSSDADGDSLNYFWSLPSVPAGSSAALSNVTSVNSSFTVDQPGTYVAQVIVDDGVSESKWDTAVISTENTRPVADPGSNQFVNYGDTVQIDGSGSFDANGDPIGYFWALIEKPENSTIALSDPDLVDPTFLPDESGIYVAQLIVSDDFLESEPQTVVFTIEGDDDNLPNWWEISVAGDLTTLTDTSDPDGDSLSALDEYLLGSDPFRWEGLQKVTVANPIIDGSDSSNRSLELSLIANEAHTADIIFYRFSFDIDSQYSFPARTGGDFGDFNFTEIATISQSLSAGDNTINWDGIDAATGQFHGYEVVVVKVISTETDGGGNLDIIDYTSDYIESGGSIGFSESFPDRSNDAEFFRNARMRFSFGSNGMNPVIANHQIYPGIWSNRLLYQREVVDWLPFTSEGRLIYEQRQLGNLVLPENSQSYFKTRNLPENSIIYTNQSIEFTNYSVEAYRSVPSLGEVLHGVFTLSGDAKVTLQLYRPDLTPYPLYYYNEGTQNYELLQGLPLGAGDHMLEFVAMNFESFESNGNVKLFDDSNMSSPVSGLDGYFRVKFIIEDVRTGKVTTYWASVLVTN